MMALTIDGTVIARPTARKAPKPTTAQIKSWEDSYAAADAGSLGVKPKTSGTSSSPKPATSPRPAPVVSYAAPPPADKPQPTPPSPYQLGDPAAAVGFVSSGGVGSFVNESQAIRDRAEAAAAVEAATGFVASTGVGSLLNESQATGDRSLTPKDERPPLPMAEQIENSAPDDPLAGTRYGQSIGDEEASVILWPEPGYYVRYNYQWDEQSEGWIGTSIETGAPNGATTSHDLVIPENSTSYTPERPDNRSAYDIMREDHWDPDGSRQNSYPNVLTPGSFNGPIEPTYDNYPVEPDPLVGAVASFLGFPFYSPTNFEGYSDPGASAAGTGNTIIGGPPMSGSEAVTGGLTIIAGEALGLANQHQGGPTLEGPAPERMQRGVPLP